MRADSEAGAAGAGWGASRVRRRARMLSTPMTDARARDAALCDGRRRSTHTQESPGARAHGNTRLTGRGAGGQEAGGLGREGCSAGREVRVCVRGAVLCDVACEAVGWGGKWGVYVLRQADN